VGPVADRVTVAELAELVLTDYRVNGKRSLQVMEIRLRKHILPFFGDRRAHEVSTAAVQGLSCTVSGRERATPKLTGNCQPLREPLTLDYAPKKFFVNLYPQVDGAQRTKRIL
jgi:hypothetical protein